MKYYTMRRLQVFKLLVLFINVQFYLPIFISLDEQALLKGCQLFGYVFHTRTPRAVTVSALGINEEYEVLTVIEFTSARKRMSVIVRAPDKKIYLYCKVSL